MSNSYTPRQQQYIDSVGGAAHQSAVVIIGILERELAAREAELAESRAQVARSTTILSHVCSFMAVAPAGGEVLPALPQSGIYCARDWWLWY